MTIRRWVAPIWWALAAGCRPGLPLELAEPATLVGANGADPTVAVDGRTGAAYVVWMALQPDSSHAVMVARADEGGRFEEAFRVDDGMSGAVSTKEFPPQVKVAADGVVYVAWIGRSNIPGRTAKSASVWLARSVNEGRTFDPAAPLTADSGAGLALYYDIATGRAGQVAVSWLDLSHYGRQVDAEGRGDTVQARALAADPIEGEFRFALSADSGRGFVASSTVDSTACICCRTAVAIGPSGESYVMWRHVFPGEIRDFVVAKVGADGAIGRPVRVHEDRWHHVGCPDIGPDIGTDERGGVHVAWYTGAEGRQGLHYAYSADSGATFGDPIPVQTGPAMPTSEVKLALDGMTAWVAWEDKSPEGSAIRLGRIDRGALVQLPVRLGAGKSPAIAAGHGRLAVVWEEKSKILVRLGRLTSNRGPTRFSLRASGRSASAPGSWSRAATNRESVAEAR